MSETEKKPSQQVEAADREKEYFLQREDAYIHAIRSGFDFACRRTAYETNAVRALGRAYAESEVQGDLILGKSSAFSKSSYPESAKSFGARKKFEFDRGMFDFMEDITEKIDALSSREGNMARGRGLMEAKELVFIIKCRNPC